MKKRWIIALSACFAALLIFAFLHILRSFSFYAYSASGLQKTADTPPRASATESDFPHPDSALPAQSSMLFPGIHAGSVTAVSVAARDRRFEFRLGQDGTVIVNGSLGDSEIFLTLLEQIAQLPVSVHSGFTADAAPALTLTVSSAGAQHTARFYPGKSDGAQALIICDLHGGRRYHTTDAWRMGTLLMTCEGTRIQDESGNEIPAI